MKQKLGLACSLVRAPELLLLDEPTVGVDPLSRRDLWKIVTQLVAEARLTVLVSTSYLDEAERCGSVVVLHHGQVLAQGPPSEVSRLAAGRVYLAEPPAGEVPRLFQVRLLEDPRVADAVPEAGSVRLIRADATAGPREGDGPLSHATLVPAPPRFEDGFMLLVQRVAQEQTTFGAITAAAVPRRERSEAAVEVRDVVRQFGEFVAVDHVSFKVQPGEMFGLLGPNGAGKTTTFRMLCGLLPVTAGTLRVAGVDLRRARAEARQRIGYVALKFSLYGQLSVLNNLEFFASAYGLHGRRRRDRIGWAMRQFELTPYARLPSGQLPGGFKQRLAMAAALLHEPEILFLDEPTSGADPLARREFWRRITDLATQGVTVIITTHFLDEAEYCDRIVIMDAGRVLAEGTPAEVRRRAALEPGRAPRMEEAFIAIVERARQSRTLALPAAGGAA
jgi:ABC-2 type transport system ATP-binding protein